MRRSDHALTNLSSRSLHESFDILKELDHAGTCEVYCAISKRGRLKDRVMAVKVSPSSKDDAYYIQQLLHHPSIVSVFSLLNDGLTRTCAMEYCSGGNLGEFIGHAPNSVLEEQVALSLLRNIGGALEYLRSKDIVHRTIDLQNVLVSSTGIFKLTNFTEACFSSDCERKPCGKTSCYSAPELVAGDLHSFPVDIWSLGCLLLAACVGPWSVVRFAETASLEGILRDDTFIPDSISATLLQYLQSAPSARLPPPKPRDEDICESRQTHTHTDTGEAAVEDTRVDSATVDTFTPSDLASCKKKPVLGDTCRRPTGQATFPRSTTDPSLQHGSQAPGPTLRIRSKSENLDQDRLFRFFMKPAPGTSSAGGLEIDSIVTTVDSSDTTLEQALARVPDLSILSPGKYKFEHGSITILPSRSFLFEIPAESSSALDQDLEILLVNVQAGTVGVFPASSRPALEASRAVRPKCEYRMHSLPELYESTYRDVLSHLEDVKARSPMLTLHLIDGKCMMMCNTPLPDVEIILRSSPSPSLSPRTMLRIRLLRRTMRLEISRRTSHDATSEWLKRLVPCTDEFPFLPPDDWNALDDDLERRALRVLDTFLPVCKIALDLGLYSEAKVDEEKIEDISDEPTFDSDFTPNFVPDLASSLRPRPPRIAIGSRN